MLMKLADFSGLCMNGTDDINLNVPKRSTKITGSCSCYA